MFYVYEWFIVSTGEIIYVGKGHKNRYKVRKHNRLFNEMIKRFDCESRIVKEFDSESDAFKYEDERIIELKKVGQCVCNIHRGGFGGEVGWWDSKKREDYSKHNIMKSEMQRKRMSENNPMKDRKTSQKVAETKKRKIVIGEKIYPGLIDVTREYGVTQNAIFYWLERGYTPDYKPCYYFGDAKPNFLIKNHACNKKPVIVDGIRFETVKDAISYTGGYAGNLINAIKKGKTYKGHECKYDNQQPSQTNTDKSSLEGSETNE